MASVNKVFLIGNLTKDIEVRATKSGTSVGEMRLAVNRSIPGRDGGERREATDFISVVVWGKTAEAAAQYLGKGSPVHVEGRLQVREWEKDGQKRSVLEVVAERVQFLASRKGGAANAEAGAGGAAEGAAEDEIPF